MNKYDELIERAKRFTDTAIVGELINAVSELKKRPDVVHCKECKRFKLGEDGIYYCRRNKFGNGAFMKNDDFCSYGEKKDG